MVRNVDRYFGRRGNEWLHGLPRTLDDFASRWALVVGPHFPDLSINYVAPATRADGKPCVLKVGVPNDGLRSEIESLGYWNGRGTVRLLEGDPDEGGLLLERVEPGTKLTELSDRDDDAATRIAVAVMRSLWRPPPKDHGLRGLASWFRFLLGHRHQHSGAGRFPATLLERAEALTLDLIGSTESPVLLHGDLHHDNILQSDRAGWLAIDPKGFIGDPAFEVAAFLRNPRTKPAAILARRLDILSAELGFDRRRMRDWCFAEAMLNACWSHDESEAEFVEKIEWAELVLSL